MNIFKKIGTSFECTQSQESYSDERIWKSENDARIQEETDDGFFETFEFLFQEHAELAASQETEQDELVDLAAAEATTVLGQDEPTIRTLSESDTNGGITSSSGSDTEKQHDKSDIIDCALNIEELYSEILYEILHYVGCDANCDNTALFSYIQEAFRVPNDFHQFQLYFAEKKKAPDILLNVEVVEAKDLPPMDSNGLSDPFVTLYLASDTADKYNTSVKTCTLAPVWEEHFALTVPGTSSEDSLCLDVWDLDEAETVKGKLTKVTEVKGLKGMMKYMREMSATGQQKELIGSARIPLISIPTLGMTEWYRLDRKKKVTSQGIVKVRVSFSSGKNNQVAKQEHRHLLRIILLHEIETSKVAPQWWCGSFSLQGNSVLTQHIVQSGLTALQVAICQWSVYVNIHINYALSFGLFSNLLDKLINPLQSESVADGDVRIFWDATKKLLPSCFSIIRKMKKKTADETLLKTITEVLILMSKLSTLEPLTKTDLFPSNLYTWLEPRDNERYTIAQVLKEAVVHGASNWFNYILENNEGLEENGIAKLQFIIQIIHLVREDIQKAIEFFDKIFQEHMNLKYVKQLYIFYQEKICALTEEDAISACKALTKSTFTGQTNYKELISRGTKLFEAYMALQRFVVLGKGVCPFDCFRINNFYEWFYSGVVEWLDIAVNTALVRIEKAVALDYLVPVDDSVKYSSSSVDTRTIFNQVKLFWQELNWPDVEGCYTFFAKIIDDICRCSVIFAQKMAERGNELGIVKNTDEDYFEVTNKLCLSINNIEYVSQALVLFSADQGIQDVIQKLSYEISPLGAETCQQTLNNVIANSVETIKIEINELLEVLPSKMSPTMKRLLIEGAELFNQDINSIDKLMTYVDNNLRILNEGLNDENFNSTLMAIWEELSKILEEIIEANLDKRRPPEFYANLQKTLDLMLGSFKTTDDCSNSDSLRRTEALLKIHGLETADLIHQVHLDLWEENKQVNESPYGVLTVRIKFEGNSLQVEVMNAKNLIPMGSKGLCDSFVRVHVLPEHKFKSIQKLPKTQTHNKTLFPLYDETFELNLTEEQRNIGNGLLSFSLKNKDLLGYNNKHVGEACIHFKDIPDTNTPLTSIPQTHLQLMRPKTKATDAVKALEHRQGDKLAKKFLNNFRQRMGST